MATRTIVVELPQGVYERVERLAEVTHRPMESVVVQTLSSGLPPLPEDLPDHMREDLVALEELSDDDLWQVARTTLAAAKQDELSALLERNQRGTIAEPERCRMSELRLEADRLMLRKAYASVLLKWRGARLVSPDDLETGR